MERPLKLCNRSISSSSGSESFSEITLNSKLSQSQRSSAADSFYKSHRNKGSKKDTSKYKKMSTMSRIQRRRHNKSNDRLAVTLHTDASEIKQRRARAGLDGDQPYSRWTADSVTARCGKIRRAVSNHESLLSLSDMPSEHLELSPEVKDTKEIKKNSSRGNSPFSLFKRGSSHRTLPKPVRKRSNGPGELLKDVLMALSGHDRRSDHSISRHSRSSKGGSIRSYFGFGSNRDGSSTKPCPEDIEDDDSDDEPEFGGDEENDVYDDQSLSKHTPLVTTEDDIASVPPLLNARMRWEASSPSQMERKKDIPPLDRFLRSSSSKSMPVPPPPPPFSPATSKSGIDVVPNDFFQAGPLNHQSDREYDSATEGESFPSMPLRNHLRESFSSHHKSSSSHLAPLAAASAAIAIATDSMENDSDILSPSSNNDDFIQSSHDARTDAATAQTGMESEAWEDCSISIDGVSMLSASAAGISMFSASNTSSNLYSTTNKTSGKKIDESTSSTGLAAYIDWCKRNEGQEKKTKQTKDKRNEEEESKSNPSSNPINSIDYSAKSVSQDTFETFETFANETYDLASYMDWYKRNQGKEKKNEQTKDNSKEENKSNPIDVSYKSLAEDTFETYDTFANETYDSPASRKRTPLQMKIGDCHPALLAGPRRNDASIVPPCMPKRSISHHKKSVMPTTPDSPSDRVQRVLDVAHNARRSSVPENLRFGRRASLDSATSPDVNFRRASLDSQLAGSPSFITHTLSKTPRTSPALKKHRKRLEQTSKASSPNKTPINSRNLSSLKMPHSAFASPAIKEESSSSDKSSVGDRWKVDVPLSSSFHSSRS